MSGIDRCRPVEVDGDVVLVRGDRELNDQDRAALAEVVRAVKRKAEQAGPPRCRHCGQAITQGRYPLHVNDREQPGKQRCDPAKSGLPYGYIAHHGPADRCPSWCLGSAMSESVGPAGGQ